MRRKNMKKRKKKVWKILVPVAVVLVIVLVVSGIVNGGNAAVGVYTTAVVKGDIRSELSTSGTIKAEDTTTYFAPANGKIAGVQIEQGDVVKSGDMLVCFDEETLAYAQKQSQLERQISNADYTATVQDYQKQKDKLATAEAEIAAYEMQVDMYEQHIEDLTDGITDVNALKKADLYADLYSVEKAINTYELAMQTPNEDTDMDELMRKKTEKQNEMLKIQNELNLLADYKTDYGWEDLLTQAKKDLADCQEKLQEAKNDKTSAEAAMLNDNKITGYQLTQEKTKLATQDTERKYAAALNGIVAEFDGVVTSLNAVTGATIQEGTQLLVLESYEKICVEFQASKYDLEDLKVGQKAIIDVSGKEYEGTVSKINKMAQPNSSGIPMVGARVHIENPDENIFLGIEAKITVITAEEEGVLLLPVEAVNIDNTGSFCFIIENGILTKKYITTGISSLEQIQVLEGLTEGDEVVTSGYMGMDIEEGMAVTVMPDMTAVAETMTMEATNVEDASKEEATTEAMTTAE